MLFAVYEIIGFGRKCHEKTLNRTKENCAEFKCTHLFFFFISAMCKRDGSEMKN